MTATKAWIVGADSDPRSIIAALRLAPARVVHILATPKSRGEARLLQAVAEEFATARVWVQHGDSTEDVIATASRIITEEPEPLVLASGSHQTALLSAAYIHGASAYTVVDGNVRELPVLPYGYATQLSDAKLAILEAVRDHPIALTEVLKVTRLKPAAASYHLNGNDDKPGLFSMRVVVRDEKERLALTAKGRALIRGVGKR